MNTFETIQKRRSIRKYRNQPVEKEKIIQVLEAARCGPSASNTQPCHVIVITEPSIRESLRKIYNRDWFVMAPVNIVMCVNSKITWHSKDGEEYWKVDAAIAMQNLVLTATELGLGTCWIAAFEKGGEKEIRKILNIPKEMRIVAMTPLGYADETIEPPTHRKPLEKMVHYEKW